MSRVRLFTLLAAVVLFPAAAQAQTTITACYVPKTGSVYRIQAPGAPEACKSSHVEFSWQTTSTWGSFVTVEQVFGIQPGEIATGTASCPIGRQTISGGYGTQNPATTQVMVLKSRAIGMLPGNVNWSVTARNVGASPAVMVVYAQCAAYTP